MALELAMDQSYSRLSHKRAEIYTYYLLTGFLPV